MSQGKGVKGPKEKKVPGWSIEEMKEKPNVAVVEDTEEMRKWMDFCWKDLAERMEEEVLDKYKVEESKRKAFRGRGASLEWRRESGEFSPSLENTTCSVSKASRRSQWKKRR